MDDNDNRTGRPVRDRRAFLKYVGAAGTAGLAGCSGDSETETTDSGAPATTESGSTDTATDTATETETETATETDTDTETATERQEPPSPTGPQEDLVFGYFPGWGRDEEDSYTPSDVPFEKLTDVLYAFLDVAPDGTVQLRQENADVHEANLSEFAQLASETDTRLHLSVGGWSMSGDFPSAAETEEKRQRFADTAVDLLREYNFDGLDVDWEHPGQGGNDGNSDPEKHVALLETCRERLDEAGIEDDKHYSLSIAGSGSLWSGGDLKHEAVSNVCDHVFVMAYDFTGTWHGQAGLNAPLNNADYDTRADSGAQQSVEEAVNMWLDNGADPSKLALGLPFYGRSFANVPAENDGLFQPFDGVPEGSEGGAFDFDTLEADYLDGEDYQRHWHEDGQVPWLYSESDEVFVSYDDTESIAAKVEFANEQEFAGVMFWELSQDRNETLLDAVKETI